MSKRLPIDLHSAERPEGDRAPLEPVTEPRLPVDLDYAFHGSAGGEIARWKQRALEAEADRTMWKDRAIKAEEALRRLVSQDCDKRTRKPVAGDIAYSESEWEEPKR